MLDRLIQNLAERVEDAKSLNPNLFMDKQITQEVVSAGLEDAMDENIMVAELVSLVKTNLLNDIADGIEDLTPVQRDSAAMILPFVNDPKTAISKLFSAPKQDFDGDDIDAVVDSYKYAAEDTVNVGIEYFDMQNVTTSVVFNVVYNTFAPKQDEFAELFFPMVAVDPMTAGAKIKARIINLWKEYKLNGDPTPAEDKIQEFPLIKAIYNTDLLTADRIKLIPVVRDSYSSYLFTDVKWNENYMDETVTTAPIKFGRKLNIISISQNDKMLAEGGADFTDGIESSIKVREVYFKLSGKDKDGNDVTEVFRFSLKNRNAFLNETIQGNNKQMVLNFDEDKFIMLTPDTKAIDENGNEVDSKIMEALPSNLKINLDLAINVTANVALGDVAAYFNGLTIKDITTKEGVPVTPESDEYQKVKKVIDTVQAGGIVLDVYATLANAKRTGTRVLTRKVAVAVTVPYRTGFTQTLPIVQTGNDGDPVDLISQIMGTRMKLNAYAVKTITEFINDMRANPYQRIQGISHYYVDNFFFEDTINLQEIADSIRSSEKAEDVRSALINKIKLIVSNMVVQSNYLAARQTLGYTGPVDVLIGTHAYIKNNIFGDVTSEQVGGFRFNYGATIFEEVKDKIIISLGVRNNNGRDIDPLNFGVCLWTPELVINTRKTVAKGVVQEVNTYPRFLHYINLPIIAVLNIEGVDAIASKNIFHTQTV